MLDLEQAADRERFLGLVAGADVVLDSATPGELERLGLGHATLAAANPALVHTSITAFGQDGPKASWPATDLTVLAASGSLVLNGDSDRPPVRLVVPQAFPMASAVATCATLIALLRTGAVGTRPARRRGRPDRRHAGLAGQRGHRRRRRAVAAGARRAGPAPGCSRCGWCTPPGRPRVDHPSSSVPPSAPARSRLMEWVCEEGHCDEAIRDQDWINFGNLVAGGRGAGRELGAAKAGRAA